MRISVALAAYNGEQYIEEQLTSILSQLGADDEVIVSDDGSTDRTRDIVNAIAAEDVRVRLVDGPQKGLIYNFENALSLCQGEFIFLSDQDDVWHSNKVETILEHFDNGADLVLHDAQMVDDQKHMIAPSFFAWRGVKTGYLHNLMKNSYIGCCMAFRKTVLDVALPFPENICMHDQWLGLLVEKTGAVDFENKILLDYRRHEGTATSNHHGTFRFMWNNRKEMKKAISKRLKEINKAQKEA